MSNDPYKLIHNKASNSVKNLAKSVYESTRKKYPFIWIGRGWSPDSKEHATGKAVDIIISSKVGVKPTAAQKSAGWDLAYTLAANSKKLKIRHILWDMKIYRTRNNAWDALPNRTSKSSVSDKHEDHLHILFDDGNVVTGNITLLSDINNNTDINSNNDIKLEQPEEDMIPEKVALAVWQFKMKANGVAQSVAAHIAKVFVLVQAQSNALAKQSIKMSANQSELMKKLNSIETKIDKITKE